MDQAEASKLVFNALAHAVAGDSDAAATSLESLGTQSDNHQMYGVCCAIAEVGKRMMQRLFGEQPTDSMVVLQELKPGAAMADPHRAFALRFLTAYANDDRDMTLALFDTALAAGGEQYVESVCALLAEVAGLCRLALAQPTT
ncbi:hypothetical protein ACFVWX_13565 [Streptomyces sp. NPDC058220]|uniref:hypothetical protein n=1 Tax=Streptomyces sp. NPDC058220 TaxID=3346387 RepID=UPI0036DFCA2A